MKLNKIFLFASLLLSVFALSAFSQSPTSIKKKCPTLSTYAQVQINAAGDINVNPCAGRSTIFTETATLPAGIILTAVANGSAAAPSINFANSPTTGIYRVAADQFGISTAGVNNATFGAAQDTFKTAVFGVSDVANTAEFALVFTPGAAALGSTVIGDATGAGKTNLTLTNSSGTAALQGIVTTVGDGAATVGGLVATYTDSTATAKLDNTAHTVIRDETGVNKYTLQRTVTAGGTTGAQTINKPAGTMNVAAGQASIVLTNSTIGTDSLPFITLRTADTTCTFVKSAVTNGGADTLTITLNAACNAETSVGFLITN